MAEDASSRKEGPFPWHLGVFDAHCHPTDTVGSIENISSMKTKALTIMATRRQDQKLVNRFADRFSYTGGGGGENFVVPAFGWHPWFSHQIYDDLNASSQDPPDKLTHYKHVITPVPEDAEFLDSLPDLRALTSILQEARGFLQRHPDALVGEVGLDKAFRIPSTEPIHREYGPDPALTSGTRDGLKLSPYRVNMDHQRKVLTAQLKLAGEMQRPVSVHGVTAHGIVFETLSATWRGHEKAVPSKRERKRMAEHDGESAEERQWSTSSEPRPFPPRICLHSYSGPPDTLRQYLHPSVPATIFFSFSILVNFTSASKKTAEVIRAVPDDKIMAESDLHAAGQKMDDLMEAICRRICQIKGWSLEDGVKQLASNWRRFVFDQL